MKDHYKSLDEGEETDIYLCEFPPCNLFNVAEAAAGHALLEELGAGNKQARMERLITDTLKVSFWFQGVTAGLALVLLWKSRTRNNCRYCSCRWGCSF